MRRRHAVACAVALAVAVALPAGAQTYPPPTDDNAFVSSSRVEIGGCVTFGGGPFIVGTPVAVTDNGDPRPPTPNANGNGQFAKEVCFGADATVGIHVLVGRGLDGAQVQGSTDVGTSRALRPAALSAPARFSRVPAFAVVRPQAVPPPTNTVQGRFRIVTATVIVLGVRLQNPDNPLGRPVPGVPGDLPKTGSNATVPAIVAGLLLVLTGSGLTVAARRWRTARGA